MKSNNVKRSLAILLAVLQIIVCVFAVSGCSSEKNDATFLKNMQKGLEARWVQADKSNSIKTTSNGEYGQSLLKCVNAEFAELGDISEYTFEDEELASLANEYYEALSLQAEGTKYYGIDNEKYQATFEGGYDIRCAVIYKLCKNYAFTVNSKYSTIISEMAVEGELYMETKNAIGALENEMAKMTIERTDTNMYALTVTNTSEQSFDNASVLITAYDDSGVAISTGSVFIPAWKSGMTVSESVWMDREFEKATAQIKFYRNYKESTTDEIAINVVDNLVMNIQIPDCPIEISSYDFRGNVDHVCSISEISYSVKSWFQGKASITISLSGTKTFDQNDNNTARPCTIGWTFYDESNAVIDSGTCYVSNCFVNETFKNASIYVSNLEPGNYILKIIDVSR